MSAAPLQPLVAPMVHRNGTSRDELVRQLDDAATALRGAVAALVEASPNARDYYLQPGEAFRVALAQHLSRTERVDSVLREIMELQEHVADAP